MAFLEIMKNVDQCLNINSLGSFISSASTTNTFKKERVFINNYLDKDKFIYSRDFAEDKNYITLIDTFTKTQLFSSFLEDYIVSKDKTKILRTFLQIVNSTDKGTKSLLRETLRDHIKNTILSYYEVISQLI